MNVSSSRESLQPEASWQELVKDNSSAGYSYDQEQHVLWIRLKKDGLVNIVLKWETLAVYDTSILIEFIHR